MVRGVGTFGEIGKGAVGKTLLAGAQSFTTNTATSAINAVNWNSGGYLEFNNDAFNEGAFGKNAWASVAGAAGSAGVSTFLTGNITGFGKIHAEDVSSVANLAGGLASSGIQYGISGETTLNVLNFADLGGGKSYGLMEMHLGGDRGFGMNLGSNGTDMSMGTIRTGDVGDGHVRQAARVQLVRSLWRGAVCGRLHGKPRGGDAAERELQLRGCRGAGATSETPVPDRTS